MLQRVCEIPRASATLGQVAVVRAMVFFVAAANVKGMGGDIGPVLGQQLLPLDHTFNANEIAPTHLHQHTKLETPNYFF